MRVDRVTYQKIFPTGMMYLNHKIGVEIQVFPDENENDAFKAAVELVEKWNKESNPHMAITMEYSHQPLPEINKEAERVEIAIDNSKSLEELNRYVNEAMKYGLIKQFLEKKKTLQ